MSTSSPDAIAGTSEPSRSRFAGWVWPALVFLACVLLLWPTVQIVLPVWFELTESSYGHGPLLLLILLWLTFRESAPRAPLARAPAYVWILLALLSAAWATSYFASVNVAQFWLWPPMIMLTVLAAFGWPVLRRVWVLIAMLYLALPVWQPVIEHVLWPATTWVSAHFVTAIGVPTLVDRHRVTIPEGVFDILEACSGSHFFLIGLLVACLISVLNQATRRQWFVLVAVGVACAVVANWIRVIGLILIGHVTAMQHPLIKEHFTYGWIIFGVVNLTYCLWARRYLDRQPLPAPVPVVAEPGSVQPLRVAAALGLFAIGPALVFVDGTLGLRRTSTGSVSWPESVLPVQANDWSPHFSGADEAFYGRQDVTAHEVFWYGNLFRKQGAGRELISETQSVVPSGWRIESELDTYLPLSAGERHVRDMRLLSEAGQLWLVRYTYITGDAVSPNASVSKLAMGWNALALRNPKAGVIAAAVRCEDQSCGAELSLLSAEWQNVAESVIAQYR